MKLDRPKERLAPKAITAWRIKGLIYMFCYLMVMIGAVLFRHFFLPSPFFILIILGVFLVLLSIVQVLIIPVVRMIYWGYEISERDIDIQHGIIVIKRSLIPMAKIQHVDTEHGPIMRFFNLATLSISTAGTRHKIPALKFDTARNLRKQISSLAALSDEDV